VSVCVIPQCRDRRTGIPRRVDYGLLCRACHNRLREDLLDIPVCYNLLEDVLEPGTTEADPDGKRVKPGPKTPARVDVLAATDQRGDLSVIPLLVSWVATVRDERGLSSLPYQPTVQTEIDFLNIHLQWITEQEWVPVFAAEIRELLHGQAHAPGLRDLVGEHRVRPVGQCQIVRHMSAGEATACGYDVPADTYDDQDVTVACSGPLLPSNFGGVRCAWCHASWSAPRELVRLGMVLGEVG